MKNIFKLNTTQSIIDNMTNNGQLVPLDSFDPSDTDDKKFFKPFKQYCKKNKIKSKKLLEQEAKQFAINNNYPEPDQFIDYYYEWELGI